jgi:hypothetical protein
MMLRETLSRAVSRSIHSGRRIAWYRAGFEIRWYLPREFKSLRPRHIIKPI